MTEEKRGSLAQSCRTVYAPGLFSRDTVTEVGDHSCGMYLSI